MPKFFRVIVLLLALLCDAAYAAPANDNGIRYDVTVWNSVVKRNADDHGKLPQSVVVSMTQSHNGYLWLGTLGGLARFDGVRFAEFDQMNTPGMHDDQIIHLFEDSRSNLWVGTLNDGVMLIKDGKAENLGIGRGSRDEHLSAVCEDVLGAIWLYTADGQLIRDHQGRTTRWKVPPSTCRSMVTEKDGLVWVGTDWKIYGINPRNDFNTNRLEEQSIPMQKGLPNRLQFLLASKNGGFWVLGNGRVQKWVGGMLQKDFGEYRWNTPVLSACEDNQGNLVVGTRGSGIWWYDAAGNTKNLNVAETHLSHDTILSLVMDNDGSLWVGTDGKGLNRIRRQPFSVLSGTEALTVQSVNDDGEGGLWMNTRDGLRHFAKGLLSMTDNPKNLVNVNGQTILVDKDQNVWAGSVGSSGTGISLFEKPKGSELFQHVTLAELNPNERDVSVLFQDHAGVIWVGTQGGLARRDGTGWKIITESNGLCSMNVQAIAEDSDGALWVGTSRGMSRIKGGEFKTFHTSNGLPGENVSSVLVDSQGVVWVGTLGTGLGRFQNGAWTHYATTNGLLSDSLGYLLADDLGNLWIGSRGGLLRTRHDELNRFALGLTNAFSCQAYGEEDGLIAGECTIGSQPGACKSQDGRLWFPTISGLATVDPAQLHSNTNAPPVVIESVLVSNVPQNPNPLYMQLPRAITVPAGQESIQIHYTSLNLNSADRAKFRYRMEGYETEWNNVGQSRTANYGKLPPGNYTFHVTACNEDDVWNTTGATLPFIVEPPFWQKLWFVTLVVLALVGIIAGVVHYLSTQRLQKQLEGMRQQQALEKERARIARDIHDQLGASMTQISLLSEMVESDKDEPAEVESHAQMITQTARDTSRVLDEIVWTVNPSNDTLEGLINYICKYAQEYFEVAGVRYRLDAPSQLPETGITPEVRHNVFLASKESITNVVKHAKATEAWLRLRLEKGRFILEVQDNGKAPLNFEGKQSRNGLRNMRKRMEDVGGTFELVAAPEGGAIARLTVPIRN